MGLASGQNVDGRTIIDIATDEFIVGNESGVGRSFCILQPRSMAAPAVGPKSYIGCCHAVSRAYLVQSLGI
jgi:hypothetical protein